MLAVGLPVGEAEPLLSGRADRVSIAAVNSPGDVTLSGDAEALEAIAALLRVRSSSVSKAWVTRMMPSAWVLLASLICSIKPRISLECNKIVSIA